MNLVKILSIITLSISTTLATPQKTECLAEYIKKSNPKIQHQAGLLAMGFIKASRPISHDLNYRIDPALLAGLAMVESTFNARAVSVKNAKGLCQLVPRWNERTMHKLMLITDSLDYHDIELGTLACAEALRERLKARQGDLDRALDYYHGHHRMKGVTLTKYRKAYNDKIYHHGRKIIESCGTFV